MSGMALSSDDFLGAVTVEQAEAAAALAYLARHDATDLAEPLGLVGYEGRHVDAKMRLRRDVWREGSAGCASRD